MLSQRRANELDNFLSHNPPANRLVSPRNPPLTALVNNYSTGDHKDRNISPNTRKPMISPVRSPRAAIPPSNPQQRVRGKQDTERTREYYCSNETHRNKKAEYIIHIEEEDMYYCGICATQAASQGFTVNRINAPGVPPRKQKTVPHHPAYLNNKRYNELTHLMAEIINAENDYRKRDPRAITEHYHHQEKLLNDFYDEQIEIIGKMRADHLNDLRAEEQANIHAFEGRVGTLKELVADLNSAWDDIEEAFTDIVQLIQEEQYQEGMKTYRNTLHLFQQKIYEIDGCFADFTAYDLKTLNGKLRVFENKLMELWSEDTQEPPKKKIPEKVAKVGTLPTSVKLIQGNTLKNVHDNLPKTHAQPNFERQEPFRNLFPEDEGEERLPEASPQFKAF